MTITPLPPLPAADATLPQVASYIGQVVGSYVEAVDQAAQMAAPGSTTGLTTAAVDALPVIADTAANPRIPVAVDGPNGRELGALDYIPSRRTADLQGESDLIGDELLPALLTGGMERSIALRALSKRITHYIDPTLPPYNCAFDCRRLKDAATTAGSAVLQSASGLFHATDVGALMFLSNAGPNYGPLETTIVSVQSSTQVTLATAASASKGDNEARFGTDDTAGLQAALNAIAKPSLFTMGGCLLLPGQALVGPLIYPAGASVMGFGGRISGLVRKPTSDPRPDGYSGGAPLWRNGSIYDDFPVHRGFSLDGNRYCQRSGFANDLFWFKSGTGADTLPSVDPFPYFSNIEFYEGSQHAFVHDARGSGKGVDFHIEGMWGYGFFESGYDMAYTTPFIEACLLSGIANFGAGNNFTNPKVSYCGANGQSIADCANLQDYGSKNSYVNVRSQEPYGSSYFLGGRGCQIDGTADDTADIAYWNPGARPGQTQVGVFPAFLPHRAVIVLSGPSCVDNHVKFCTAGGEVHPYHYATHGVFLSGDASRNHVTLYIDHDSQTQGYVQGGTGAYAPGDLGTDSSGGVGSTNRININDLQLS